MHIPDGFLDTKTAVTTAALSAVAVGVSLRTLKRSLPRRRVPLIGLAAAFVFAAQMVNFPVVGGTSGHLTGGMLAAVLLGPAAAIAVLTAVLLVQCFLFADGGLLALGANILNIGIAGPLGGYAVYRLLCRLLPGERGRLVAAAMGGWSATILSALFCAGELAWSGTIPWDVGVTAMVNVHLLIGGAEGVITLLVLSVIMRTRPDLAGPATGEATGEGMGFFVLAGGVVTLCLVLFVAPFSSPMPDGLESVVMQLGILDRAEHYGAAPMAGYMIPGLDSPVAATAAAGVVGTALMFVVGYVLARTLGEEKGGEKRDEREER
ncbi:MAG: energy-coupling factor ABC transporter permease [Bacteroidota bacterium]